MTQGLVFVYNADSGLFNSMADAAHKVFSPDSYSCNLCKVTYGWLSERAAWRDFIAGLDMPCTFLHRDEFRARWPGLDVPLPAVLQLTGNEAPNVCIDADTLNGCADLDALKDAVRQRCGAD
ncbi:hypothetical protein [uncultured Thiohalocapsa sp.]|uniref:hypothetical protein n=1 Tax=uncultured Thiohalocapsa sp. TaxID=768990 RepID=UPI0025D6F46E|nr:hypothetical protein [uncultured Thiohalocapsa sp.]